jgi:sugar O-acyltransferase (sialic acid O-acetyltransferase NeuD family)
MKVFLQGGGDHARVVVDCLHDQGIEVIGIFDPKYSGDLFGVPQLGQYVPEYKPDVLSVIAIGDNAIRKKVAESSRHGFINVVHPTAVISSKAEIGNGNMVLHRAILQAKVKLGSHVIVNTAAQIDHDCIIDDFVHLAPGCILCGTVTVGEGSFIGAGAVIIPGKKVGKWAVIGAGTVVRTDVPDYAVVVGNPGKIIRYSGA